MNRPTSMNEKFQTATSAIPTLFVQLMASPAFTAKGTVAQRGRLGIYVFFEDSVPVHVGRTRNLGGRLRAHVTRSHHSASFAFKRARRALGKAATYPNFLYWLGSSAKIPVNSRAAHKRSSLQTGCGGAVDWRVAVICRV
jgi:hypothetical protein